MDPPDSCTHCGANLGPADLDKPACPYCGTAHPHIARARQRVEALRQVFAMGGRHARRGCDASQPRASLTGLRGPSTSGTG